MGTVQALSSLADLSPCGFATGQETGTWADAIAESGAIVMEGPQPAPQGFSDTTVSCLLRPIAGSNGYTGTPLSFHATGINSSGAIVGATCPNGSGWSDIGICTPPGNTAPLLAATAVVSIPKTPGNPLTGTLNALGGLTPCGFATGQETGTVAVAISESGAIIVEGPQPAPQGFTNTTVSCLLHPIAGSNGYTATPLSFHATGINSSGAIVGATCPNGSGWSDIGICTPPGNTAPLLAATAAINTMGATQALSSLADLSPCGFATGQETGTWADAISESGAIVIEGPKPASQGFSNTTISCLLTPRAGSTGQNSYVATPLSNQVPGTGGSVSGGSGTGGSGTGGPGTCMPPPGASTCKVALYEIQGLFEAPVQGTAETTGSETGSSTTTTTTTFIPAVIAYENVPAGQPGSSTSPCDVSTADCTFSNHTFELCAVDGKYLPATYSSTISYGSVTAIADLEALAVTVSKVMLTSNGTLTGTVDLKDNGAGQSVYLGVTETWGESDSYNDTITFNLKDGSGTGSESGSGNLTVSGNNTVTETITDKTLNPAAWPPESVQPPQFSGTGISVTYSSYAAGQSLPHQCVVGGSAAAALIAPQRRQ
jgi:hypothetical protein